MDPLSDLLSPLRIRVSGAGGFDLAGAWGVSFGEHDGIKCYAVVRGRCVLTLDGDRHGAELAEGDGFILPRGRAFRVTSQRGVPVVGFRELDRRGDVRVLNGGGECFLAGGHFAVDAREGRSLLDALPSVVHIAGEPERATLRWSVERLRQELVEARPGAKLMARQLGTMLLVQAFRRHVGARPPGDSGPLSALADPQLARALAAIHADPAHRWTVAALARIAGASRSRFAQRFAEQVGRAPISYVADLRMQEAARRLTDGREPVSSIARSLGYKADSAFAAAFKRATGSTPRVYGRAKRASG